MNKCYLNDANANVGAIHASMNSTNPAPAINISFNEGNIHAGAASSTSSNPNPSIHLLFIGPERRSPGRGWVDSAWNSINNASTNIDKAEIASKIAKLAELEVAMAAELVLLAAPAPILATLKQMNRWIGASVAGVDTSINAVNANVASDNGINTSINAIIAAVNASIDANIAVNANITEVNANIDGNIGVGGVGTINASINSTNIECGKASFAAAFNSIFTVILALTLVIAAPALILVSTPTSTLFMLA